MPLGPVSGSDRSELSVSSRLRDYTVTKGVNEILILIGLVPPTPDLRGALTEAETTRFTDITDGLSNTIMLAEDAGRWQLWHQNVLVPLEQGGYASGGGWADDKNPISLVGSTYDGNTFSGGPCPMNCTNSNEMYSFHRGGANTAFADGSVHFLNESMQISVLAAPHYPVWRRECPRRRLLIGMGRSLAMGPGVAGTLWTQPQVYDLEQFLHGPAAQKRLHDTLSQLLSNTHALGRCLLDWAEFKPGRKLVAHYQVEARRPNGDAGDFRPIALIWRPHGEAGDNEDELSSLEEQQRDARVRKLTGPWQRLVADFPECCLRVQGWPLDSVFPQLVRVSDCCHVREMLCAASVIDPASDYLVVPVRYRPGERHVLRYTRADGRTDLAGPIFAKLYESAASAARAFRLVNRVGDLLAASDSTLRSVRPVGCVANDAVVLYPGILGTPLSEHLRGAGPALAQHLGQAGSMLRILHTATQATPGECHGASGMRLRDELTPHRGFAKEVKKITRRTCEHIHALLPELGARIKAVLAAPRSCTTDYRKNCRPSRTATSKRSICG